ncbi:MAG TPA: hypothetical protein VMB85_10380 [Bryobacteraceae bacterium]|nr:hypothetical protein [Bryobacteraceae bacterium]
MPTIARHPDREQRVREAKAIVALAVRNGPIEDLHAGKVCPTCDGQADYSHVTDANMKRIMKNAVDVMYRLCSMEVDDLARYEAQSSLGRDTRQSGRIPRAELIRDGIIPALVQDRGQENY